MSESELTEFKNFQNERIIIFGLDGVCNPVRNVLLN